MVFGRSVKGTTLTFAPSGLLRQSNLVMWDLETESWWQQGTAEAIVGTMAGARLETFPAQVISFRDFRAAFPQGTVLGGGRFSSNDYNPYFEYDTSIQPMLFEGVLDHRLSPMERMVGIHRGSESRVYPFEELARRLVVQDKVGGNALVIFYEPTAVSPLDQALISQSRSVGAASVFSPQVEGRSLTFEAVDGAWVDRQTGSTWNILGQAVEGALKGERLQPFFHTQSFWFYWAAIYPETTIYPALS